MGCGADRLIPVWFKLSYLIFAAVLVPAYALAYGLVHFLWFSNVALMGGLLAAWLESRRLASMMAVAVALLEMPWVFDFLLSLALGGPTRLGIIDYLYNPDIALHLRLLSLYHLLLPFVLLWMVWRLGYDREAWKVWVVAGCAILLLSFWLSTPERNINWVWGPGGQAQEWTSPYVWFGIALVVCLSAWWLTHRFLLAVMRGFGRRIE
jgi:hypothetical protein